MKGFLKAGLLAFLVFGIAIIGVFFSKNFFKKIIENLPEPVKPVAIVQPQYKDLYNQITSVGTLISESNINVISEVNAKIENIYISPGQTVKAGELLLKFDDTLAQADFQKALAAHQLSKFNFERDQSLLKDNAISDYQFEISKSQFSSSASDLAKAAAMLDKYKIYSPINGQLDLFNLSAGQFLAAGSSIFSIVDNNNLLIDFPISESDLVDLNDKSLVLITHSKMLDQPLQANIIAFDNSFNPKSRNIFIRAKLLNKTVYQLNNVVVDVELISANTFKSLVIPKTSIIHSFFGKEIMILKKDEDNNFRIELRSVKLGQELDEYVEIIDGLDPLDIVVLHGQNALRPKQLVKIAEN